MTTLPLPNQGVLTEWLRCTERAGRPGGPGKPGLERLGGAGRNTRQRPGPHARLRMDVKHRLDGQQPARLAGR